MAGELLALDQGAVRILTIRNPSKRNALDPSLCDALAAAFARLEPDGVRAAVLTGDGDKAFCAGFDLAALGDDSERAFESIFAALSATGVPVVAALNGVAFGGGCDLAAACDQRIGHEEVSFLMPPAKLGLVYAPRGLARMAAICGESRARRMFLFARTVDAREAHRIGLLDDLVARADVLPRAVALAEEAAALAPLAVRGMRRLFEHPGADATELRARAWNSDDAREARAAFAERRKPVFRGA